MVDVGDLICREIAHIDDNSDDDYIYDTVLDDLHAYGLITYDDFSGPVWAGDDIDLDRAKSIIADRVGEILLEGVKND